MENQHRKIKGYRELSQAEIDLMNEVKAQGVALKALIDKVRARVNEVYDAACQLPDADSRKEEYDRLLAANPHMWINTAEMEMQVALMKLTRAVAQPSFF